jgi:hypothetical protein
MTFVSVKIDGLRGIFVTIDGVNFDSLFFDILHFVTKDSTFVTLTH